MTVQVLHGDCLSLLPTLPDNSIDAIVTDPPYCLDSVRKRFGSATAMPTSARQHKRTAGGFMGKTWDNDIAFKSDVWNECYRVLKPGGHIAVFGGSRTHHRVWVAVEDAGFEIRDTLMWVYGSGFPKSLDVSKAIDRKLCAEREVVGTNLNARESITGYKNDGRTTIHALSDDRITAPATPQAEQWQGWGTALKPSHEPILLGRKPLIGTVAENVLVHGTGGINVDACRVLAGDSVPAFFNRNGASTNCYGDGLSGSNRTGEVSTSGRWPPNLLISIPEDEYNLRNDISVEQKQELYRWLFENA